MKLLVLSSSQRGEASVSRKLAREYCSALESQGVEYDFLDLNEIEMSHALTATEDMKNWRTKTPEYDGYVLAMAVYNYTMNDQLKSFLDGGFDPGSALKPVGVLCAGGSQRSYLATDDLMRSCLNEWQMAPYPMKVMITEPELNEGELPEDCVERIKAMSTGFSAFSQKLSELRENS